MEHKLFVGNMNKTATEEEITEVNTSVCLLALFTALIGVLASKVAADLSAIEHLSRNSRSEYEWLASLCLLFALSEAGMPLAALLATDCRT